MSYELANGPIPDGLFVCHACDNPPCVNPAHLWLGTCAENMADAVAKGRMSHETGPRKLTPSQVLEIRAKLSYMSQAQLAIKYGMSPAAISNIATRKRWRNI